MRQKDNRKSIWLFIANATILLQIETVLKNATTKCKKHEHLKKAILKLNVFIKLLKWNFNKSSFLINLLVNISNLY